MNKVVYVKSFFKPVGETKTIKVPTGEKTKGFFGGEKDVMRKEERWEQTGWSDCEIDGERLTSDIEKAVQSLNSEGYEVVSVIMTTSGRYKWNYNDGISGGGYSYGYGYGFSYTEGAVIIAKKTPNT